MIGNGQIGKIGIYKAKRDSAPPTTRNTNNIDEKKKSWKLFKNIIKCYNCIFRFVNQNLLLEIRHGRREKKSTREHPERNSYTRNIHECLFEYADRMAIKTDEKKKWLCWRYMHLRVYLNIFNSIGERFTCNAWTLSSSNAKIASIDSIPLTSLRYITERIKCIIDELWL